MNDEAGVVPRQRGRISQTGGWACAKASKLEWVFLSEAKKGSSVTGMWKGLSHRRHLSVKKSFIHVSCIYLQLFYTEHTLCSSVTISSLSKKAYLPLSSLLIFLCKIHYYLTFHYTVSFLSPLLECIFHASKDNSLLYPRCQHYKNELDIARTKSPQSSKG